MSEMCRCLMGGKARAEGSASLRGIEEGMEDSSSRAATNLVCVCVSGRVCVCERERERERE